MKTKRFCLIAAAISLVVISASSLNVVATENWYTICPIPQAAYALWNAQYATEAMVFYDDKYAYLVDPTGESYSQIATRYFIGATPPGYRYYPIVYPGSNATITAVNVIAAVKAPDSTRTFVLGYSYGIGTTTYVEKQASTTKTLTADPAPNDWKVFWFNITSFESWTPSKVVSNTLWASIMTNDGSFYPLYVDYLGLTYNWTQPGGGSGWFPSPTYTGPNPEYGGGMNQPGYSIHWPSFLGGEWIVPMMGVFGFFGAVICPAMVIRQYRNHPGNPVGAFTNLVIMETAFIVCLWVGIQGALGGL